MTVSLTNDKLRFTFPELHPDASCSISFQRTLRIPDDDQVYPLPPGLGLFPIKHVDDFKEKVPDAWRKHQGVMLPMYQSEALWILFESNHIVERRHSYPFAIKIAAGKRCAVTGNAWSSKLKSGSALEQDYVIIPGQPWLDGFVVEKGKIKQFIAVPLGMGLTVESQLDGKEEFGGLQIQVYPMKSEIFEKKYPKIVNDRSLFTRSIGTSNLPHSGLGGGLYSCSCSDAVSLPISAISENSAPPGGGTNMGFGAGGTMKQYIYKDDYELSDWNQDITSRTYVHLTNSLAWRSITGNDPPHPSLSSKEYTKYGLPWFDYYSDKEAVVGSDLLKGIKSVKDLAQTKGIPGVLPENESIKISNPTQIGEIKNGEW